MGYPPYERETSDDQPQDPTFNPAQANRALAVTFAASVLSDSNRPGVLGVRTVKVGDIIDLAAYVVGSIDEDAPMRWATTGEAALEARVAVRQVEVSKEWQELLSAAIGKGRAAPVAVQDVRAGDQLTPAATDAAHDADTGQWVVQVQCPQREKGDTFPLHAAFDRKIPVFNRAPEAEGVQQLVDSLMSNFTKVKPEDLREGDQVAPDGDVLVSTPEHDSGLGRWTALAHCPRTSEGDTFEFVAYDDQDVPVFNRGEPEAGSLKFEPYKESEPEA